MKFTSEQKKLAKKYSPSDLANMYKGSEKYMQHCAYKGDKKGFDDTMKLHQNYEYALLYQLTPEYRKKREINKEKRLKSQITMRGGDKAYMTKMKRNY